MPQILLGTGIVPGVASGKLCFWSFDLDMELGRYRVETPAVEQVKVLQAMADAQHDIRIVMNQKQGEHATEQQQILAAHVMMLQDPELISAVAEEIATGLPAPQAVRTCCERYAVIMENCGDAYMAARAADIRDIATRVLKKLLQVVDVFPDCQDVILCAEDIAPSVVASLPTERMKGIVLAKGAKQSHAMILVQSKNIPTLIGVQQLFSLANGTEAILDAERGQLIASPDEQEWEQFTQREEQQKRWQETSLLHCREPALTLDGAEIVVAANISEPGDMQQVVHYGADGVGLFRSEFLFLNREQPPTEDEQFDAYKQVIEQCGGHRCVIRTLDVGGDKPLPYLQLDPEQNPFLGCRGIRVSLRETCLFLTQLKALLRAAVLSPLAIMLPMVIGVDEVRMARHYLDRAKAELQQQGSLFGDVSMGIMVETPSAALQADVLAEECDFFSIGSNDLTQYTLAADRGNNQIGDVYDYFHPSVLTLIRQTTAAAHRHHIRVGVCGAMAADRMAVPLLVGLGIDELSVPATRVPAIKDCVRGITRQQMQTRAQHACTLASPRDVKAMLQS